VKRVSLVSRETFGALCPNTVREKTIARIAAKVSRTSCISKALRVPNIDGSINSLVYELGN
jgi:hypothetical protein